MVCQEKDIVGVGGRAELGNMNSVDEGGRAELGNMFSVDEGGRAGRVNTCTCWLERKSNARQCELVGEGGRAELGNINSVEEGGRAELGIINYVEYTYMMNKMNMVNYSGQYDWSGETRKTSSTRCKGKQSTKSNIKQNISLW